MLQKFPCGAYTSFTFHTRCSIIPKEPVCSNFTRRYNVLWTLTVTNVSSELGETVETYGIRRGDTVINDISLCKDDILYFVEQLNRLNASEIHACDLVEDFLGK